ncbi:MAG: hypothetical protein AAFP20_08465 [Cyanobacteria bacterium J06614_10]
MSVSSISKIVQNGIWFDLKNWRELMPNGDNLTAIIDRLFKLLEERQVDYLLVGGVALLSYVDGRNTQDIDFIFSRKSLERFPELVVTEENKDFARANFGDLQVALFLTDNQLFSLVQANYETEKTFGSLKVRTSTVEGLILLKLYALPSLYRQGKFDKVSVYETDILLLMLRHDVDIDGLLQVLTEYLLESDMQEINQVVADISKRMERFR